MLYTPYIDGAMEYVEKIYSWNQRVDEMRIKLLNETSQIIDINEATVKTHGYKSVQDYYECHHYYFNNGLRLLYEERNEYTQAKLSNDTEEMIDALVDQFIVAIGEIRKCSLADDYQHIDFWEDQANNAYGCIDGACFDIAKKILASDEPIAYANISSLGDGLMNKAITEVLDALDTRFGDDAYIDENGKFIKSKSYRKPNLSFLTKV